MDLKTIKHGFNGFTQISRIRSRSHSKLTQHILHGLHGLHGFSHERIRVIRENPLNPCLITLNLHE
ncbi:MAG: hypothetical protein FWG87_11365 [Defluviitaleaceae bacterium]|nr:hypothetical protein [Defluviitaleaceae bacterium]